MITAEQLKEAYDTGGQLDYVGDPVNGFPAGKVTAAKKVFAPTAFSGAPNKVYVRLADGRQVPVPAADLSVPA